MHFLCFQLPHSSTSIITFPIRTAFVTAVSLSSVGSNEKVSFNALTKVRPKREGSLEVRVVQSVQCKGYGMGDPGPFPDRGGDFYPRHHVLSGLVFSQPPNQWLPGPLTPRAKLLWQEAILWRGTHSQAVI
jgi:hypothetical protein